jgi:hypothetical protein
MSQQETIIGKLKLMPKLENETLEDQCKRIYNEQFGQHKTPWLDSFEEDLMDECYEKFVIYNNDLYEVIQKKDMDYCDMFNLVDNNDGTYNFSLSYYNGGYSFSEAIERAFENMERKLDSFYFKLRYPKNGVVYFADKVNFDLESTEPYFIVTWEYGGKQHQDEISKDNVIGNLESGRWIKVNKDNEDN